MSGFRFLIDMKMPEVSPDIKQYLSEAYLKAQQWFISESINADKSVPITVAKVAVIGGGTMGRGIAISFVRAGYDVILVENNTKALDLCIKELETTYTRELQLKRFTETDVALLRSKKFRKTTDLNELTNTDLVIEAVFENLQLKRELLSKLEKICPEYAIFGTNTSSLDLDKMSSHLLNPSRVVGIHFLNPAHVNMVVEIVYGAFTGEQAIATAFAVVTAMKKIPILVGNCPKFVFNRLLAVFFYQAHELVDTYGMYPKDIDAIVTSNGFLMGPFTIMDMIGIDVGAMVKQEHNAPLHKLEKELMERQRYGRKTGRGYYIYDTEGKKIVDADVEKLIDQVSARKNRNIQFHSDEDVLEFLQFPVINEGFLCLEEGIIGEQSSIDLMFILGFGWPPVYGGPMKWVESMGTWRVAEKYKNWNRMEPSIYMISKTLRDATAINKL